MSRNALRTIRLVFGAAELEAAHCEIPAEYVAEVTAARAELALMRGSEVVAAVEAVRRAGLSLALDLRPTMRVIGDPPPHQKGRFG